jgi:hypothetical protein
MHQTQLRAAITLDSIFVIRNNLISIRIKKAR